MKKKQIEINKRLSELSKKDIENYGFHIVFEDKEKFIIESND